MKTGEWDFTNYSIEAVLRYLEIVANFYSEF